MSDPLLFIQDLAVILVSATILGLLCVRLGLSPVVGYLTAGLIVGTKEITFPYVTDEARVQVIGQLGVVFLMFGIGLQFRLKKLRELGLPIILATVVTALLVLTIARIGSGFGGLSAGAGLCLAAVFMVSSSAVIAKVLPELGLNHQRFAKVALGMTLMEDIVAVIMLAVIGTYVATEAGTQISLGLLLISLAGFALLVLLAGFVGLPRVFRVLERSGQAEILNIFVCGGLLLLALLAVQAGYSLALGAFLFGLVVAETRQRVGVERAFQGLKDVFLTVFFVTIGMLIDVRTVPDVFGWIMLGIAAAILGRGVAASLALLLVGEQPRDALRAGLVLTPIGEFSFIIAGIAVASGLMPEAFQATAVGVALGTSVVSPLLVKHASALTRWLRPEAAPRVYALSARYAKFWEELRLVLVRGNFWKFTRKRFLQVGRDVMVITALLLFAEPIYAKGAASLWSDSPLAHSIFWAMLFGICLIPLVAIWRNLSVLAWIFAEMLTSRSSGKTEAIRLGRWLRHGFHLLYVFFLTLWLWNLVPAAFTVWWLGLCIFGAGAAVLLVAWRPMVRLHSQLESSLEETLEAGEVGQNRIFSEARDRGKWLYEVEDFVLPDDTAFAGMPLGHLELRTRTGASIVGIERSGFTLQTVGPSTHLFPRDQLLLLGSRPQLDQAKQYLTSPATTVEAREQLESLLLRTLTLPDTFAQMGQSLAELDWPRRYGMQVVEVRRGGGEQIRASAATRLQAGDQILLIGTRHMLDRLCLDLSEGKRW